MNKVIVNYEEATEYNFDLFSPEDRAMYQQILAASPYNPELAEFFNEERRLYERIRKNNRVHCSIPLDDLQLRSTANKSTSLEAIIAEQSYIEYVLSDLTETERRRFCMFCYDNLSSCQIAQMEGTSQQAVHKSIQLARQKAWRKIKKKNS